jgi:fluoroacetyl-CoA thioesterase
VTLELGLIGEATRVVDRSSLASSVGSGGLDVFSTPSLIALIENAACEAVEGHIAVGQTTVGVRLDVRHIAPTPLGVEVRARAELIAIDSRKLIFRVEAFDPHEKIGEGTHERAIVDAARLLARASVKRSSFS